MKQLITEFNKGFDLTYNSFLKSIDEIRPTEIVFDISFAFRVAEILRDGIYNHKTGIGYWNGIKYYFKE